VSPRQLRLHETTDGCDKGNKTGPFALAPGGLVAAPAAGLRGDTFALAPGGLVAAPAAGLRGEQERGEGGVTGKSTKSCLLTRNQKPVIDLP
jgi:hypothetical protein